MKRVEFYICEGESETPFPQQREDPYEGMGVIEIVYKEPTKMRRLKNNSPAFRGMTLTDLPRPSYSPLLDNQSASLFIRRISELEE